jgi:hypothetical protein
MNGVSETVARTAQEGRWAGGIGTWGLSQEATLVQSRCLNSSELQDKLWDSWRMRAGKCHCVRRGTNGNEIDHEVLTD